MLVAGAIAGGMIAWQGWNEEGLRLASRYTARFAFVLFLPLYAASSLHRLWPSARTRRLMRSRRALGLAFAASEVVHIAAFVAFHRAAGTTPDLATLIVGGGAFVAMFAMAATSNDTSVRRLGRRWRQLHRVGIHWLFFVFAISYAGRVVELRAEGFPLLALALGALGLRVAAVRTRRRVRAPVSAG